jgi:hopene-associated glycosyltransferase HpnB
LALVVLGFWCLFSADPRRRWGRDLFLRQPAPAEDRSDDRVTAIVPARDEVEMLPRTLPALLGQEGPKLCAILVDDRSSDGSAEAARRAAVEAGLAARLVVISKVEPPPGWSGKVHALDAGVRAAASAPSPSEWLLFTDADIDHRPGSTADLLRKAAAGPFDLVSVMARLNAESFWERLLIPPFVFFFHGIYPFRLIARPDSPVAAAAGGCVLVRREALERAGGLERIAGAIIDDVSLARLVKGAGGRLWLGFDQGIVSLRRYRRLSEIWAMVSRCAFVQLRESAVLLALALAGLGVFFVSPPIFIGLGAGLWALGRECSIASPLGLVLPAAIAWALQSLALLPSVRHHRAPRLYAIGLPAAALLYACMTFSSAWRRWRGRGATWKGRSYSA